MSTLALVGIGLAVSLLLRLRPDIANGFGLGVQDGWYIDLGALLAAGEAHVMGLDVYQPNPLDIYQRPHSYSNWWLAMGDWGLTRADVMWLGTMMVVALIAAAAWTVKPRSRRELGFSALVLGSTMVQLCLVRANNDIVVFVLLAGLVPCLTSRTGLMRVCAVFLIALAAGLKYYPAAAGLLLLHDDNRRRMLWRIVLAGVAGGLVLSSVYEDTRHFTTTLPSPDLLMSFGAANLLERVGLVSLPWRLIAAVVAVSAGTLLTRRSFPTWTNDRETAPEALWFVLGAVLLAGCFWLGRNWGYRWIFGFWLLPALLRPVQAPWLPSDRVRNWLLGLMMVSVWWDGFWALFWYKTPVPSAYFSVDTYVRIGWWIVQPCHWTLVVMLSVVCVRFTLAEFAWHWRTSAPPSPAR